MSTEILQVRPDPQSDPDGSKMGRFVVAHLLLERAVARRVFRVHLVALLGVPLFLCAAVPSLHIGLTLMLALFGTAVLAALWALYDESVRRNAAKRAERGVYINTINPPS